MGSNSCRSLLVFAGRAYAIMFPIMGAVLSIALVASGASLAFAATAVLFVGGLLFTLRGMSR